MESNEILIDANIENNTDEILYSVFLYLSSRKMKTDKQRKVQGTVFDSFVSQK